METNTVDEGAPKPVGAVTAPREGGGIPSSATNMPHSLEAAIHRCVGVHAARVRACLFVCKRARRASERNMRDKFIHALAVRVVVRASFGDGRGSD